MRAKTPSDATGQSLDPTRLYRCVHAHARGEHTVVAFGTRLRGDHENVRLAPQYWADVDAPDDAIPSIIRYA
jgi:hypothetical protein